MHPRTFFKCLSDETRLFSVLLISLEKELCVCELMVALDDSQPKISRHLAQLRECQLLQDRRQGQWIFYRLNPELPDWAREVLRITRENNRACLGTPLQRLKAMADRPQRCIAC